MTAWKDSNLLIMITRFKKKSMEWVGAQSAGGCARTEAKPSNKTFTPSDRDIRPNRRTKWIEEQAADAKLATDWTIGSVMSDHNEANLHEFPNSLTLDSSNTTRNCLQNPSWNNTTEYL